MELENNLRRQASGLVSFTMWDTHSRENPLRDVGSRDQDTVGGNLVQHSVCRAMGQSPTITSKEDQDPKLQTSCLQLACSGT